MRLTETKRDLSGGNGQFFKLNEGATAQIRFLYNKVEDIKDDGLVAHVIRPEESGQQFNIEVLCGLERDDDPIEKCKWCKAGKNPVGRYPLALYNETSKQIEYWGKTKQWVENNLMTLLQEVVAPNEPVSGQVFKIIRTGNGTQTQYTIVQQGKNDGKTPEQFGEIKIPEERNCYRPADFTIPAVTNNGANFQQNYGNNQQNYGNNQQNYGNNFTSNRRTTDIF